MKHPPTQSRGWIVSFVVLALLVSACAPGPATPTQPASAPPAAPPTAAPKPAAQVPTAAPAAKPTVASPAPTAASKARQSVVARFAYKIGGQYAAYPVAKVKGYYAEEGLDVGLPEGNGSLSTLQAVAADPSGVGLNVDFSILPGGVSKGMPVRVVATTTPASQLGVCLRKESNVRGPQDLVGKKFALPPGGATTPMLMALLAVHKIDPNSVTIVNSSVEGSLQLWRAGQVDGFSCVKNDSYAALIVRGTPADAVFFAENGVAMLGVGIVANQQLIDQKASLVRGFVRASLKGFDFISQNVEEAADIVMKEYPNAALERPVLVEQIRQTAKLATGKGHTDPAYWKEALALQVKYAGLEEKAGADASVYFTNDFIK